MHFENRAETRDPAKRDALVAAQRKLLTKIRDAHRSNKGLFVKLEDVNSSIRQSEQLADQTHSSSLEGETASSARRDSLTDEDLEDMFKVLKK